MRVLGVDPGLTRCGLGVVEGGPGRPLRDGRRRRRPHPDDRRAGGAAARRSQTEIDAWLDRHAPDAVAVERVFANANVAPVMGTAQASARRRCWRPRGAASRVGAAHPERGQGGRHRQRPGRQGAGHRDGDPHPAARRSRRSRPTPPTRSPWPSATSGAVAPRTVCSERSLPRTRRWPPDDRVGPGRGRSRPGWTRPSSRSVGSACSCTRRPARPPGCAAAAQAAAGHHAGRARGLAHALRLRRRRRARRVRAGADRLRGRARGSPWRCSRCTRPTSCAAAVAPVTSRR